MGSSLEKLCACALSVLSVLVSAPAALGAGRPVPVSPGSTAGPVEIGASCPTFSWAPAPGSTSQELVIYRLEEAAEADSEPVRRVALPGNVGSWTPPLAECLERGASFAWSVRAEHPEGEHAWSEAGLFNVAPAPSLEEVEAALAVLERYRTSGVPETASVTGPASPALLPIEPVGSAPSSPPSAGSAGPGPSPATSAGVAESPSPHALVDDVLFVFDNDSLLVEGEDIASESLAAVRGLVSEHTVESGGLRAGVVGEVVGNSADPARSFNSWGVVGVTNGAAGSGVRGDAVLSSGFAEGVLGITNSPDGYGGHFFNNGGGVALSAASTFVTGGTALTVEGTTAIRALQGNVYIDQGFLVLDQRAVKPPCIAARTGALYYDSIKKQPCFCDGALWRSVVSNADCS